MLTRLVIQDVVLIDRLTVPFHKGLNVFTGETGAGKSILLDALALALGARSDASLVRAGQAQASVTAEFTCSPSSQLAALLDEQGLILDDPLILRRTVSKDGKSRAFLCDQPIGVTLLRRIGELLLEVHGQFETHGLLNPATHRDLLDSFADTHQLKNRIADSYAAWKRAVAASEEAKAQSAKAQNETEFLALALRELDELAPQEGEIDSLTTKRAGLQNREKILQALTHTESLLSGERGAAIQLAQAGKTIAKLADKAPDLADILARIDKATQEAEDAAHELSRTLADIENDPHSLETIEERLFKLRAIARKHDIMPDTLPAFHLALRARYGLACDNGADLKALDKRAQEAKASYLTEAQTLSTQRAKAAEKLAHAIESELPPLKLERASFHVICSPLPESQWNAEGTDHIAFLAATNAGSKPAPLHKVASGGELARFMLAIKVVLSKASPVSTLVFDEVDAGIGGQTASAVGERLAGLSRDVQVLVVTHSPQIAARGGHHLRVRKQEKGKYPTTLVDVLDEADRVEEIARMLAGAETTDAARAAARSLIDGPAAPQPTAKKKRMRA